MLVTSHLALGGGSDVNNIINGFFTITNPTDPQFGWTPRGSVSVANGQGVLSENPNVFSELSQNFVVPTGATALRFTVYSQFSPNGKGPPDAFEAALLNTNTGISVVDAADRPGPDRRLLQPPDLRPDLLQSRDTGGWPPHLRGHSTHRRSTGRDREPGRSGHRHRSHPRSGLAGLRPGGQYGRNRQRATARPWRQHPPRRQSRQLHDAAGPAPASRCGRRRAGQRHRPGERPAHRPDR